MAVALQRLIYASRADGCILPDLDGTVRRIIEASERNNRLVGVTGLLLAHKGWFLQALEGSPVAVRNVFSRVSRDRRHRDVKVLDERAAAERAFGDWSMCGRKLGPADDAVLDVLDMRESFEPLTLDEASAMRLLTTIAGVQSRRPRRAA